ncbi:MULTISPECIES: Flp family type IVb pilin [Pseudomonas]|jgi:pilus assembly protein Flp/PilA|uniref:Flp family type IVb pilin n=1 Tax=Pseudomonas putida TaxID=303 RepID=A0A379KHN1_PSEPU|nr:MULTISPECIES: Flp family type IVb pilin [Pseudomonas]QPN46314.1 Flp family type IVb pilin [Priestia aryabhattai]MBG6124663.1 pilus assembly protein Flp/PilA [Pseudomonas sp. M2]MBM7399341.1 pilus assembly protein Flp/PilA [Pseudomonas sp. M5]NSX21976.1 Flp family type IVb pilin [Pseudomonas putida]NWC82051.1 Flp family type IVb pilin [Pseudomonas putida]
MLLKQVILHCKQFLHRKDGASGIEYAVIAAMVAVVLAGFVPGISGNISTMFTAIQTALN